MNRVINSQNQGNVDKSKINCTAAKTASRKGRSLLRRALLVCPVDGSVPGSAGRISFYHAAHPRIGGVLRRGSI
ncbi:MAG: hypothetical protein IIU04_02250 [Bacteroidales bacterium]|nr:hypothetical protein [Bacteroidales bacterium]